jgi:hypothetical protein
MRKGLLKKGLVHITEILRAQYKKKLRVYLLLKEKILVKNNFEFKFGLVLPSRLYVVGIAS